MPAAGWKTALLAGLTDGRPTTLGACVRASRSWGMTATAVGSVVPVNDDRPGASGRGCFAASACCSAGSMAPNGAVNGQSTKAISEDAQSVRSIGVTVSG